MSYSKKLVACLNGWLICFGLFDLAITAAGWINYTIRGHSDWAGIWLYVLLVLSIPSIILAGLLAAVTAFFPEQIRIRWKIVALVMSVLGALAGGFLPVTRPSLP